MERQETLAYDLMCQQLADSFLCELQQLHKSKNTEKTTIEKLLNEINENFFKETKKDFVNIILSFISFGLKNIFFGNKEIKEEFFLTKKIEIDWWYYDRRYFEKGN